VGLSGDLDGDNGDVLAPRALGAFGNDGFDFKTVQDVDVARGKNKKNGGSKAALKVILN